MYHCHLLPISLGYDHILPGVRSYLSPYLSKQHGADWEYAWRDSLQNSEVLLVETPQHILAGALVFSVSSDVCYVHMVFLHTEYRRSALVARILRSLDVLAGARGCRVVRCFVDASNTYCRRICLASGFVPIRTVELGSYLQAELPLVRGRAANRFTPLPITDPPWVRDLDFDLQRFAGGRNLTCSSCIHFRNEYCQFHAKPMDEASAACSQYRPQPDIEPGEEGCG